MGGIIIKPRIIVLSKRNLMIYAALVLVVIIGIIVALSLLSGKSEAPSSGYTYLKYKDGKYIGSEKTEYGNIKAEVIIEKAKIKEIKLLELPAQFIEKNTALKDEIPQLIYDVIQNQNIVTPGGEDDSAYILIKITKAIRCALDKSLIEG